MVFVSAVTGEGLGELTGQLDRAMPVDPMVRRRLRIPISDGRHLSFVHGCGRVMDSQIVDGHFHLDAELPESLARELEEFEIKARQSASVSAASRE